MKKNKNNKIRLDELIKYSDEQDDYFTTAEQYIKDKHPYVQQQDLSYYDNYIKENYDYGIKEIDIGNEYNIPPEMKSHDEFESLIEFAKKHSKIKTVEFNFDSKSVKIKYFQ